MEKCLACGKPRLAYLFCERWDCPQLLLKDALDEGDAERDRDDSPQLDDDRLAG